MSVFQSVCFRMHLLEDTDIGIWPGIAFFFLGRANTWEDTDWIYIQNVSHRTLLHSSPTTFYFYLHILQEKTCARVHFRRLLLRKYAYRESVHQQKQQAAQPFPRINVRLRRLLWTRECKQRDVRRDECANMRNAAIPSSTPSLFPRSGRVGGGSCASLDFLIFYSCFYSNARLSRTAIFPSYRGLSSKLFWCANRTQRCMKQF